MSFEDWDKEPDGNISVRPMMGYSIAAMPMGGVLRLEYAASEADLDAWKATGVQVHMNASQARELAEALIRMADRVDNQPLGRRQ